MTLNEKCFYKSLKKDYTEIGKYALALIGLCIGFGIGYAVKEQIVNIISNFAASYISIMIVVGITLYLLYETAIINGKDYSKKNSSSYLIIVSTSANCIAICVSTVLYVAFLSTCGRHYGDGSEVLFNAFVYENIIVLIVTTIISIIGMPIAVAYARCKDEPEIIDATGEQS